MRAVEAFLVLPQSPWRIGLLEEKKNQLSALLALPRAVVEEMHFQRIKADLFLVTSFVFWWCILYPPPFGFLCSSTNLFEHDR